MKTAALTSLCALALVAASSAAAAEVRGRYLEARNAEIYASHCFANSELGIRGDLATMAWVVDSGSIEGVSLDGLGVVAVIKASGTLGDPFSNPLPAKAVLIFDERADEAQRAALETLVTRQAGELTANVIRRESARISFDDRGDLHARRVSLRAGELVTIETRPIDETDSLCHLDSIYYRPLVELEHAMPAFSLVNSFHGHGLNTNYDDFNRSSAYLGRFTLSGGPVSDD